METNEIQTEQEAPKENFDENGIKVERAATADEKLNRMVLSELEATGAQHILTVFFETGQISSFPLNIDREKLESRLQAGGFVYLPEVKDADGFKDGKVLINMSKIIFTIIRSKSLIVKPKSGIQTVSR